MRRASRAKLAAFAAGFLFTSTAPAAPLSHALDTLTLRGERLEGARVVEGGIVAGPLSGAALEGARIEGDGPRGGTVVYEIARVVAEEKPLPEGYAYRAGATWLYELRWRDAKSGAWKPLCGADADGLRLAIPLAGRYDARNAAHADARRVAFACTRGVMAKCYRWGYRPWLGPALADAHQACIRMAMADYCGDGRSWTRDGTLINKWDDLSPPVQHRYHAPRGMSFEAAWNSAGAVCIARPRWTGLDEEFDAARCTARAAMPPCHSEEEALRVGAGAPLLFNASQRNRVGEKVSNR